MALPEIHVPETEPETEWVRDRALQKMSPTRKHSLVQIAVGSALCEWAGTRAEVGTEWRFRVAPPDKAIRPLVPDVSLVYVERLRGLTGRDLDVPQLAPDVVVEVLSPDDRRVDVDDKIVTFLAAGSALVVIIDPDSRQVELHDRDGRAVLDQYAALEHAALPGFNLPLGPLFAQLDPP